jgi:hypothetical protein
MSMLRSWIILGGVRVALDVDVTNGGQGSLSGGQPPLTAGGARETSRGVSGTVLIARQRSTSMLCMAGSGDRRNEIASR